MSFIERTGNDFFVSGMNDEIREVFTDSSWTIITVQYNDVSKNNALTSDTRIRSDSVYDF